MFCFILSVLTNSILEPIYFPTQHNSVSQTRVISSDISRTSNLHVSYRCYKRLFKLFITKKSRKSFLCEHNVLITPKNWGSPEQVRQKQNFPSIFRTITPIFYTITLSLKHVKSSTHFQRKVY